MGANHGHPLERFFRHVNITDRCWLWTAALNGNGYGSFRVTSDPITQRQAHRFAYESLIGAVPDGLELDHAVCKNKRCVNPWHLEPVTHGENSRRDPRKYRVSTHCKQGHEFTPENTYRDKRGNQNCRTCRTAWGKSRRQAEGSR